MTVKVVAINYSAESRHIDIRLDSREQTKIWGQAPQNPCKMDLSRGLVPIPLHESYEFP